MKPNPMMIIIVMGMIMLISLLFAVQGVNMHVQVAKEEAKFHALQEQYYNLDKAARDGADTGSELNKKLVRIKQYPSALLELKLVGIGKILIGIYVLLFGILVALLMMPIRLGMMLKKQ